jgi:nucleoid DNA-binding protein
MNKTELAAKVAALTETSKNDAGKYVNAVLSVIADNLCEGDEEVSIPDFGRFYVKNVPARTGMNPQTKEKITIEAHKKIVFKASDNMSIFSRKHG